MSYRRGALVAIVALTAAGVIAARHGDSAVDMVMRQTLTTRVDAVLPSGHNILVMSEYPPGGKKRKPSLAKEVPAAEFKATCLDLMNKVKATGAEYVITKHGKPVAKLVPVDAPKRKSFFGSMKGTVLKYDDPFGPIPGEWDINK